MAMVANAGLDTRARPRVSVCIANYNGEAMLADCIESVLGQETDAGIEILVHDDASQDGSIALLEARYPQVEVLRSTSNVGFCIANNRMVATARGEYVLLLNNDAALHADAIRHLLEESTRHTPPAILTLPQFDWDTGAPVDRGCLLDPMHVPSPNLDPQRRDVAYVIGACMFMPRSLWNELDGFPDWFGSMAEDMYLCSAAKLRRAQVACTPGSGYRHRQGASFGGNKLKAGRASTTYRRRYLSERNRIWVLVACTPSWLAWPWLAAHVIVLVGEGAALSLLSRSLQPWQRTYWPALRDAWRQRAVVLAARHRLQRQRTLSLGDYLDGFTILPRKLAMLLKHGLPSMHG